MEFLAVNQQHLLTGWVLPAFVVRRPFGHSAQPDRLVGIFHENG
jgi:hypothetical protein